MTIEIKKGAYQIFLLQQKKRQKKLMRGKK